VVGFGDPASELRQVFSKPENLLNKGMLRCELVLPCFIVASLVEDGNSMRLN
jgi:hypothetical protein